MKAHALQGTRMVEKIPELRCFVPPIRFHHERYDGKGYPDGLSSIDIPLHARIVAVADAFNAMIARRPYRAPLSPTAAIEELKRHSGTQFDRVIVEAMIDVILQ
jgi:HD-GYP domain-containing protein (c-di-GMP phosphodiesterase class II)